MRNWMIRWSPRLAGYMAAAAVLALFWGGDIKDYFQDRQQNKDLRAQACAIMVSEGFLPANDDASCRQDSQTYLAGVLAATTALTPKVRVKLDEEVALLQKHFASVAIDDFEPVPFDTFLDLHQPVALFNDPATSDLPLHFTVDAPWIMITGYGQIRAEDPVENSAALLDLDRPLGPILNGALNAICTRTAEPELGCRGRLYISQQTGAVSAYRVVGMKIEPLSDAQIKHANLQKLQPPFDGGTTRLRSFYLYRFVQWFGEDDA